MPHSRTTTAAIHALLAGVLLTALAGCAASSAEQTSGAASDWQAYDSLAEAAGQADLVATGTVLDSHEMRVYPQPDVDGDAPDVVHYTVTVTSLRVTEVLAGEANAGDVIEIYQTGTEQPASPSEVMLTDAVADVESDDVLVLLTQLYEDGPYDLFSLHQGLFLVDGDAVTPLNDTLAFADVGTLDQVRDAVAVNTAFAQ